jgi:hypothetical protein
MHIAQSQRVLEKCRQMIKEKDWKFDSTVTGINLERKNFSDSPIPAYRCSKLISKTSHDHLIKAVWDVDENQMKKLDSSILTWQIVESGEDWRLIRQINYVAPFIWSRESLIMQHKIIEPKETWFVTYTIDDHEKVPRDDKKYVRANIVFNTFGFIQEESNTLVHKITLADPKGYLPVKIVTMFSHKMVHLLNYLTDFAKQ